MEIIFRLTLAIFSNLWYYCVVRFFHILLNFIKTWKQIKKRGTANGTQLENPIGRRK